MPFTLVSLHAHPDDEVLYTGGTLARAAAEGHRVVLVTATAGEAGLAAAGMGAGSELGARRRDELERSARALGVARVVVLGYGDSGLGAQVRGGNPFAAADPDEAAGAVAAIVEEERADVLTIYDAAGGYGHPDHVQVHRVGVRAAARCARPPLVLEATVDRDLLRRVLTATSWVPGLPEGFSPHLVDGRYTARAALTHRVDVRAYSAAKRAAMAAHVSQASADRGSRTLGVLLKLPRPLFRRILGTEWFVEHGRAAGALSDDIFASLRRPGAGASGA